MYKFTVSLPKLTLQQGLSLGAKMHLPPPPNRNLSGDSLPSKCDLEVKYAHQNLFFARVGWPNIGVATTGPARPDPTALGMTCLGLIEVQV